MSQTTDQTGTVLRSSFAGWMAWGVATVFVMYQLATQNSLDPLIETISGDLHLSTTQAALVSSVFLLTYGLMQMPAGLLLDRYRPRLLLPPMALAVAVTAWLLSMSTGFWTAMLSRAAMGAVAAFAFPGAGLVARRRLPAHRFALAMGLIDFAFGMGAAAGDDLVQWMSSVQGWREIMVDFAMGGGVVAVCCAMLIGRTSVRGEAATEAALGRSMWRSMIEVMRVRQVRLAALSYASMLSVVFGLGGLWDVPVQQAFGWSRAQAVSLNAWMWIGMAIMPPIVGYVSDRMRRRKPLLLWGHASVVLWVLVLLVVPMPMPYWFVALNLFLLGLSLGTSMLCFPISCDAVSLTNAGATIGLVNCVGVLAAAVLQVIPVGVLSLAGPHSLTGFMWVLAVFLVVTLAGTWCTASMAPDHPRGS